MLPRLEPTKNMLVILPDRCMRLWASLSRVGKVEAMNNPVPMVPIQSSVSLEEKKMMISKLRMTPQKFTQSIF